MKRLFGTIVIVLVIVGFAACSSPAEVALPSAESTSAQSVMRTFTVSALPSPAVPTVSPMPAPSFVSNTDIPDVVLDPGNFAVNSGSMIYENNNYIFFSSYSDFGFYIYDKATDSLKQDSPYLVVFTLFGEKAYYAENGCIKSYDPSTGQEEKILRFDGDVYKMLVYNDRLYYTYSAIDYDNGYNLCSVKLDGTDSKPAAIYGVDDFCLADSKVYYTTSYSGAYLYEYGPEDGHRITAVLSSPYGGRFEIKGGMMFFCKETENSDGICSCSLEKAELSSGNISTIADGCWSFAILGQYAIYVSEDHILCAYDTVTGIRYKLLELEFVETIDGLSFHSTPFGAYLAYGDDGNYTTLYRISISGGKASLEEIAEFPLPQGE